MFERWCSHGHCICYDRRTGSTPEDLRNTLVTIVENGLHALLHIHAIHKSTDYSQWQGVMHDVSHKDTLWCLLKTMLMVPECIGSKALFIHEKMWCFTMRNFGGPTQWYIEQWAYLVIDDQTWIHLYLIQVC